MSTGRRAILAVAIAVAIAGVVGAAFREPILARWDPSSHNNTLVLSGNIEAHESVLSFKIVQSRIVQLPFNEG
jgi:HlyD family secretion protein